MIKRRARVSTRAHVDHCHHGASRPPPLADGGAVNVSAQDPAPQVQVVARESDRRVDITIGGKPFTSYLWPDDDQEAGAVTRCARPRARS